MSNLQKSRFANRLSHLQLRQSYDRLHIFVGLLSPDGTLLDANQSSLAFIDAGLSDVVGQPFVDTPWWAHCPESQEALKAAIERGAQGEGSSFEARHTGKSGDTILVDFRLTPVFGDDGQVEALLPEGRDITDLKVVNETLRESEQRFKSLVSLSSDWYWEQDSDFRFTTFSDSVEHLAGSSVQSHLGRARWELPTIGVSDEDWSNHRALLERHEPFHDLEYQRRNERGEVVWLNVSGEPVFDSMGDFVGYRGVGHDISRRKQAEEELRRSRDELERRVAERTRELEEQQEQLAQAQKMEAIGQLTGGVAHDFNNLMTAILGNLEMVELRLGDDEVARRSLTQAQEATELGAQLTSRLLAFARRQPLDPKVVDLNRLILEIDDMLRRTLGEAVKLNMTLASELQATRVDSGQLQNALLNLCLNARDAMPECGELTIETANIDIDQDAAESDLDITPGAYVRLSVTDNGVGMPPEVREKVFEPFFTTKEVGQGSGLGLSMVYGFAKQSGGHVQIYSEAGLGTTVSLCLPRIGDAAEDDTHEADDTAVTPAQGETILVVEDDVRVRHLTVNRLQMLGYKVLEAEDGRSALRAFRQAHKVDLLFTDVVMPGGMTGRDLAKQVRQQCPETKVLLTSGYARPTNGQSDLLDEDMPWLRKPYRRDELARKLRDVLDG